jgi:CheY-like chemotaxis protein/DNA-binding MarR family transcriptional regulator
MPNNAILLLDDDPVPLNIMRGVLGVAGYECFATHSAEEAIALIAGNSDITVVVSDINMPEMDGLEFLDRLRKAQMERPLPSVLFLTGHPSMDHAIAALRLGAVDFLVKPMRPAELLHAVRRACQIAPTIPPETVSDSWAAMQSLAHQAESLARRLRNLTVPTEDTAASGRHEALPATGTAQTPGTVLDMMGHLRRLRHSDKTELSALDDVAWDLLAEVLRSERNGRRVSVSGLSISVEGVSSTTAFRRINELVAQGHFHRVPDPTDARRDFVTLDDKTRAALDSYLARAAEYLVQSNQKVQPNQKRPQGDAQ